ncbi:hypothetical protein MPNT_20018 [Candidatus Methylacidithermus pantelleriae]|uniref:Uncharacterized protein n=1 Tax=Candidatus Methylacidithermus pantelleriae TaxID=2744239 RepID=A0A8J2FNX3_9BACT|nr:hypothetical protein MPNT_20018 [Candidatus Methylacidithermus pantelleriae]
MLASPIGSGLVYSGNSLKKTIFAKPWIGVVSVQVCCEVHQLQKHRRIVISSLRCRNGDKDGSNS